MNLAKEYGSAVDLLYELGDTATYVDSDGNSSSVVVLISYNLSQYGESAEVQRSVATISCRVSDVPSVPRKGEQFTVRGKTYFINGVTSGDELEHTVLIRE